MQMIFPGLVKSPAVDDAGLGHDRRLCLSGVVCRFGKPRKLAGAAFLLELLHGQRCRHGEELRGLPYINHRLARFNPERLGAVGIGNRKKG